MEIFPQLIKELGESNGASLEIDGAGTCKLILKDELYLQLEPDNATGENLIMTCPLGEIPPGSYRRDIFKRAMIANWKEAPRYGIFSFSSLNNNLVIFDQLRMAHHSIDFLTKYLEKFIHRSLKWHEAIQSQDIPPMPIFDNISNNDKNPLGGGMPGLTS
ncbi:hypothetical protein AB751O23_AF_00150 [Chlamydiales bacterium SCGC AB-751-O23]|jgi:hypothetical protein|nr:hypothetical protein AB751O23_AF_00150 [Chlamydiales bacterium SCGC AB-751-O23]